MELWKKLTLSEKYTPASDIRQVLKVDMPILTCIFFTFNWLTLTSEMHFVKFHPEVASCLLSRGKRKYAPLGMRLLWKYIRNYFLVYHLISHVFYNEFEAEILDLQSEKYGLSFDIKKYTTSSWALGDDNVIGIRAFKGHWNLISGIPPSTRVICFLVFFKNDLPCLRHFELDMFYVFINSWRSFAAVFSYVQNITPFHNIHSPSLYVPCVLYVRKK